MREGCFICCRNVGRRVTLRRKGLVGRMRKRFTRRCFVFTHRRRKRRGRRLKPRMKTPLFVHPWMIGVCWFVLFNQLLQPSLLTMIGKTLTGLLDSSSPPSPPNSLPHPPFFLVLFPRIAPIFSIF